MSAKPFSELPVAPGLPVVGNMSDMMTPKLRAFLTRNYRELGPVFRISALGHKFVVFAGPEGTQFVSKEGHRVLRSENAWRPNDLAFGAKVSMTSTDGEIHRLFRRVESRAFSKSYLAARMDIAYAIMQSELEGLKPGQNVPVADFCKRVITEQLAQITVGGTTQGYLDDLLHYIQTTLMVTVTRQLPAAAMKLPAYKRSKARIDGMVADLIERHRADPPEQSGRAPDLIDDVLADTELHPELWGPGEIGLAVTGAFIAGMDTAANSLAYVLYRLHRHPELLPALRAEVDALFQSGPPTLEALGKAPLLHSTVMEALRVHPIAPALNRTLVEDVEFGGYHIPAGTELIIGTTVAHGLEEFYTDPEKFDPSRFLPPRNEHRRPGAYAPFGAGAHTCGGSGMAEGLMMLNTAAILHSFDLWLDPTYRLAEVARPTPSPDKKFKLQVFSSRHPLSDLRSRSVH